MDRISGAEGSCAGVAVAAPLMGMAGDEVLVGGQEGAVEAC